jgi:hypothetical protein
MTRIMLITSLLALSSAAAVNYASAQRRITCADTYNRPLLNCSDPRVMPTCLQMEAVHEQCVRDEANKLQQQEREAERQRKAKEEQARRDREFQEEQRRRQEAERRAKEEAQRGTRRASDAIDYWSPRTSGKRW